MGRNGAPAAVASTISPICSGWSNGKTTVIKYAHSGTSTKFATRARMTSLGFFNGPTICGIVRLIPMASMLVTMKSSPDTWAITVRSSEIVITFTLQRYESLALPHLFLE